jgi:3-hydroxyisobutyrate dehydrogenase
MSGSVTAETIGVIGIGTIGWPMAGHLVRAGYDVRAYDADRERTGRFAHEFATRQPRSLGELADASVILTMLPTGAVVRAVLTDGGETSLMATLRPRSIVIDTTSSEPNGTRELGSLLAQRGVSLIDASVSGGLKGAVAADLVFMMGGDDEAAIERAQRILAVLGKRIFRMGQLGSGNAMKAMNNLVSGAGFAAACEAVIVGQRYGLDPATMMDVLNASTGRNFTTENNLEKIVTRSFDGTFALSLFAKDIGIAATMADAVSVASPISHLVHRLMMEARDAIGGDGDHTTAFLHWERIAASTARD